MAIRVLDAATVGRIAAGEVVERPSSVLKELIENSIDAGAGSITIEVKDGGISYMRVTDNGSGIPFAEARLAFENHATSKLASADMLDDIRTLGFRGEALPSIAAVSKVQMTTRQRGADTGARVEIEGGRVQSVSEVGCPEGTTIIVRELFYNLPVRRAFLKKPGYEQGVLTDVAQKIALGNPGISIKLIAGGRTVLHSYGGGKLRDAALAVYGREYALKLRDVDAMEGGLRLSGLIGVGEQARPTRDKQSFFINGRLIRCQLLSQALEDACRGRVTTGMYPACMLNVTMPPGSVDVNVHPSKLEVRFRDEAAFRLAARSLMLKAFAGDKMLDPEELTAPPATPPQIEITRIDAPPQALNETQAPETPDADEIWKTAQVYSPRAYGEVRESAQTLPPVARERAGLPDIPPAPAPEARARVLKASDEGAQTTLNELKNSAEFKLIGTAFSTYILVEYSDKLIMIDQHAAHERIKFEEYMRALDEGIQSQQLLIPYIVNLSKREVNVLEDNLELLRESGYDIEPFGDVSVNVRSVPFILGQSDMRMLFTDMIDSLSLLKNAEKDKRVRGIIEASCKHAVKAGDRLTDGEILSLIDTMLKTGAPPTCPHGRPVLIAVSRRELEQAFKRVK